jgi:hypothetical protein
MKIRTCFVSNSSSSSFVVQGTDVEDIKNRIAKAIDSCPQLKGLGMKVVNSDSVLRLYPITDDLKAADRRRICRDIQEYTWWRFRPSELKTGTTRIVTAENSLYDLEERDEEKASAIWDENPETFKDPVEAIDEEFGTTHKHLG